MDPRPLLADRRGVCPAIGLLVFANLVARFLLFATAWTATSQPRPPAPAPGPTAIRPPVRPRTGIGVSGVLGVFTAGALAGLLLRRRGG